jgi:hypothetical protein
MSIVPERRMRRRDFLLTTAIGSLALGLGVAPVAAEDHAATHNMLVFGEQAVFLSHLPMFDSLDDKGAMFMSPHRYQVILEAGLTAEQLNSYVKDRHAHPNTRFYTLEPELLVLSRLFTPAEAPRRTSFTADLFRGHLEHNGVRVSGLQKTNVKIARVVHGRQLDPRANKPASLEYLLFGRGKERFLAHAIFTPPDFDQVLPVNVSGEELTDHDLNQNLRVVITDKKNTAAERLRDGQRVEAMLHKGTASPKKVQLEVGPQIYFEEGELLVPPADKPTAEEKRG